MKILLIGGTGIISTEVCKLAIDRGNEVFILNRGKRKKFIHPDAKLIIADMHNESDDAIRGKFKNVFFDVVVDFISFSLEDLKKSTRLFADLCDQYIFISSATVYETQPVGTVINEDTNRYNPQWNYAAEKITCEDYIRDLYKERNKGKYTIIRPYVTYGITRIPFGVISDYANYTLINRMLLGKPIVLWDGGEAMCTLTYAKDFAVGVVGLFKNEKAYDEAFHITSPVIHRWKDVYHTLRKILNVKDNHIDIPTEYIVKCMPRYSNSLLGDKARNMVFDNTKIKNAVPDFTENTSLEEGLHSVIEYYQSSPEARTVDYKWDGQIDHMINGYCKQTGKTVEKRKLSISSYGKSISLKHAVEYIVCRNGFLFWTATKLQRKGAERNL